MEWVMQKWGGRFHRSGGIEPLGDDGHGNWFWQPAGSTFTFADGEVRTRERDVLFLLPDDWWCASWWTDHPRVAVYVDIATPPEWDELSVVTVDLDLDVIETIAGDVEVEDRDEFELHRERYGYPPDVIEAAERSCAAVCDLLANHVAPFDRATPRSWFARIESAREEGDSGR